MAADDDDAKRRQEAEDALERFRARSREYNQDKLAAGKKEIPPATYNVLFSAIILLTLKDAVQDEVVTSWVTSGAPLEAAPVGAIGAPLALISYALFQLAFSFGTGQTSPFRNAVLKLGITEPAFSSPLNDESRDGGYACAGCGAVLFDSSAKYDSGSGWPAFWRTADGGVVYEKELLGGRMEIKCAACGGHLGHVFSDGPRVAPGDARPSSDPGGPEATFALNDRSVHPRFCVNGAALRFEERRESAEEPAPSEAA